MGRGREQRHRSSGWNGPRLLWTPPSAGSPWAAPIEETAPRTRGRYAGRLQAVRVSSVGGSEARPPRRPLVDLARTCGPLVEVADDVEEGGDDDEDVADEAQVHGGSLEVVVNEVDDSRRPPSRVALASQCFQQQLEVGDV